MRPALRLTAMLVSFACCLTACADDDGAPGEPKAQQSDVAPPSANAPSDPPPDPAVVLGGITGYALRDDTERAAELMASGAVGTGWITARRVVLGSDVVGTLDLQQSDRPLTAEEVDRSLSVTQEVLGAKGDATRQRLGAVDAVEVRLTAGGTSWSLAHSYFVAVIVTRDDAIADDLAKQLARLLEERG